MSPLREARAHGARGMRSRVLCISALCAFVVTAAAEPVDFAREVQPIFAEHCLGCHGAEKQKSGYRLDVKGTAFAGGDTGEAAIIPGKPELSPLLRVVSGADKEMFMPPKKSDAKPLDTQQIAVLERWIREGAAWPEDAPAEAKFAAGELKHWSLQPLHKPDVPAQSVNPIDAFVQARLAELGFTPSPEADRRTLIRRVYFDLTGLPPSVEEVDAFVANGDLQAYEKLVDRLLASPRYGERWARHWLDVVHFGETHGYDKDQPRPNAWPYRDYVIRAFNEDKPYARFVQEQVAGDVLFPGTVDGITALGFIAAGPWDLIGHTEVPETKIDGKIARHLDRDDMVSSTINTFSSITVHCAQCHDHKFDPVSHEDYYALQAVFAGVDRADKPYFADAALTQRYAALRFDKRDKEERKKQLDAEATRLAGERLTALDKRLETAAKSLKGNAVPEFGYHSAISPKQDAAKWVQVDLGGSVGIDRIVLQPCFDDFGGIGAGFGFPVRFRVEVSDDPAFQKDVVRVGQGDDEDLPNPGLTPIAMRSEQGNIQGRYVRVTATKLAPRTNDFIFALAELQVLDAAGKNLAADAKVTALDSIEAGPRWAKKNLVDGHAPVPPDGDAANIAELRKERAALLEDALPPEKRAAQAELGKQLAQVESELASFPKPQMVYAGTVHYGAGAFSGTGPNGGKPRTISVLARGDVTRPGKEVSPGALSLVKALPARFELAPDAPEGERRAALARWLSDERNVLTWRSIVNRVWQYHFGRGIVESPNDFGKMGVPPTHPELLDWLAVTFRDEMGGSFKQLHRLIVTSAAYRQSSEAAQPKAMQGDAENRYLWRQNRRRLEAEAIRDSILAASGKLDLTMGGPSFQDFVITHPEHSPHYEYHLADPDDVKLHRRAIYRFIVRSQQQPWMAALDCADPSMLVDKRNQTITPLQALAQLNNQLTVAMAKHFAARMAQQAAEPGQQINTAFRLALQRSPTAEERDALTAYVKEHGLPNACRLLLNLNEFVFVD